MSTAAEGQADNQTKSACDDPLVWIDCEVGYAVLRCIMNGFKLTLSTDDWSRPGQ